MDNCFVTYNTKSQGTALQAYSDGLEGARAIVRGSTIYRNFGPSGISLRDGFNKRDYENIRTDEYIPERDKDIMRSCMEAYRNIGIIKNTIDLMTDLVVRGIDVVHPVKSHERFYKKWFNEVAKGIERSERITNLTYRAGTAVVKRQLGVISVDESADMKKVGGALPEPREREIPMGYTILNPLSVEVLSDELVDFISVEDRKYGIRLGGALVKSLQTAGDRGEDPIIRRIPQDLLRSIRQTVNQNRYILPLKNDEISVISFKKDDWEVWAKPICHAILDDLNLFQKMKLADLSALDGAISQIRLWKIGSLDKDAKILPRREAFERLANMLVNCVSGGVADIMWGPAIDLIETSTDLHHFLGETKYVPVLKNILIGLGLPQLLSGYSGGKGFTNNMVEIKVFVHRLQYMRQLLEAFWRNEFKIIQKAMGFAKPAQLVFDISLADDEAVIKNVLLSAVERNLISEELFQERINAVPEIEKTRIKREWREKQRRKVPPKASPFHDPEGDDKFRKEVLHKLIDAGRLDGAEVLEKMLDADIDEVSILDKKNPDLIGEDEIDVENPPSKEGTGRRNGRPPGSKDKKRRQTKRVTPVGAQVKFVENLLWAEQAQKDITEAIHPVYLRMVSKENLRQLTDEESSGLESLKFALLCNLEPGEVVCGEVLKNILKNEPQASKLAVTLLRHCVTSYINKSGVEPSIEKLRNLQSKVVAILNWGSDG